MDDYGDVLVLINPETNIERIENDRFFPDLIDL